MMSLSTSCAPCLVIAVVLAVVDVADFDGSMPRAALKALLPRDYETGGLRTPRDVDLVIAVNKVRLAINTTTTHINLVLTI